MGSSNPITPGSWEPGLLVWKKGETDENVRWDHCSHEFELEISVMNSQGVLFLNMIFSVSVH